MAKRQTKKEKALTRLVSHLMNRVLVARYDSLKRQPTREQVEIRTELSETENNFTAEKRVLAYALTDRLVDNTSLGSIIDSVCRLTIGRTGGTLIFSGEDRDTMAAWFKRWSKSCGYCEDETLQEVLSIILHCVLVHGDCIAWIDPVLTDGKIRIFDADQICDVALADFDAWKMERGLPESCRLVGGMVVDGTGRVHGAFVTPLRNRYSVNIEDALFLPAGTYKRVALKRKFSEYRGEPAILRQEELTDDCKNLIKSELGAAKLASQYSFLVKQAPGMSENQLDGLLDGYKNLDELAEGTGIDVEQLGLMGESKDEKTFEAFNGMSAIGSLPNGADVVNLTNSNRPSPQVQTFLEALDIANGKALGIMSCLAKGICNHSYSSGEIELQVSWKAFEELQGILEGVIDYIMGVLWPNATYDVHWPKAVSIDPEKEQKTFDLALKNGLTTFKQILGSDWKQDLQQLAEEKEFLKSIGLDNLSFFMTSSGNELTEVQEEHKAPEEGEEGTEDEDKQ